MGTLFKKDNTVRLIILLSLLIYQVVALPKYIELNISDIIDDPYRKAQDVGWCGEASIQSAITTYGIYIPQKTINSIYNKSHKDLYTADIPETLNRLGFGFEFYPNRDSNYSDFILWIKRYLSKKIPVMFGLLIYPNPPKGWDISHFMLATGYTENSLIFNSNSEEGRDIESFENLYDRDGYSFLNSSKAFFGVAIGKTEYSNYAGEVQLKILKDTPKKVTVKIITDGLKEGDRLYRYELEYNKTLGRLAPIKDTKKLILSYPKTSTIDEISRDRGYIYKF